MTPLVSVVIATYNSNNTLDKLVASLDAQSLPQEQFEVIFVDNGSSDDTFTRLQRLTGGRQNYSVQRIEDSGWLSRPRNVGLERARGVYVTFLEQDGKVFPNGLYNALTRAREADADILIPHEEKVKDMWTFLSSLDCGNVDDIESAGGFSRMIPMVPHKLYRRTLLLENGIEFPDEPNALWEDQYVNIAAYRYASKIAVAADVPYYQWRGTDSRTGQAYDPLLREYWDRLEDLMDYTQSTLQGPELAQARASAMAAHIRTRVIDKFVKKWDSRNWRAWQAALKARALLKKYLTEDVLALLSVRHRVLAILIKQGRLRELAVFEKYAKSIRPYQRIESVQAGRGGLQGRLVADWAREVGDRDIIRECAGGYSLELPPAIHKYLPPEILDVSHELELPTLKVAMRERSSLATWVPSQHQAPLEIFRTTIDAQVLRASIEFTIDPNTTAYGAQIEDGVWDLKARGNLFGFVRAFAIPYPKGAVPFVANEAFGVAYSTDKGALAMDNSGALRTFATDSMSGELGEFNVADVNVLLPNASGFGNGAMDAKLSAQALNVQSLASLCPLDLQVVNDGGECRLQGSIDLPEGTYALWADRQGKQKKTARTLIIDSEGTGRFK
ncbi:glycosyltransferase family 2 protein [Ancrocorticia populi]|uniref:Glycosyltransferase 2-like domain-containing protein n=1 Tax=Ancrocorticia populi TaxID=2175228 RepID=A0A2V1KCJ1_9ACTO|nr:glycosyltransferase [Ancrocorticia populi]PWF27401.1 hypothetical protein DD236_03170 [Ancrocorticia populi]